MITTYISCILIGNAFSPKKLEEISGITLGKKEEKGDIAKLGKYKGKKLPYGSGEIKIIRKNEMDKEDLKTLLSIISQNYGFIKESGATDIFLTLTLEYQDQCNWEFDNEELSLLAKLGIKFSISCYRRGD